MITVERLKLLKYLIIFVFIALFFTNKAFAQDVLIINSYHQSYSWTDDIVSGVIGELKKSNIKGDYFIEYLDWKRYPDKNRFPGLAKVLKAKYLGKNFPVIIVSDNIALEFAIEYKSELFNKSAIVFCGINGFSPDLLKGETNVTGIAEVIDPIKTIDLALSVHTNANEILFICDSTESSEDIRNQIKAYAPKIADRAVIRFMINPSCDEVEKKVMNLPGNYIVLLGLLTRDKNGKVLSLEEMSALIGSHSVVPSYGLWEQMIGSGIVGGYLLSGELQGKTAGDYLIKILNGKSASQIPINYHPENKLMFDYDYLRKYYIDLNQLPKNSIVINKPYSIYDSLKTAIWTVLGVILVLALIVIWLILFLRRMNIAEKTAKENEQRYRTLVNNLPGLVYRCDNSKEKKLLFINDNITAFTGFEVEEYIVTQKRTLNSSIHRADIRRVEDAIDAALINKLPYFIEYRMLDKFGKILWVSDKGAGVYSVSGNLLYFDGVIFDVTERVQIRKDLEESEEKHRFLLEQAADAIFMADLNGKILLVNRTAEEMTGYSRDELYNMSMSELFQTDDIKANPLRIDKLQLGKIVVKERMLKRRDSLIIPIEMNSRMMNPGTVQSICRDVTERIKEKDKIVKLNRELEVRVKDKTAQLYDAMDELKAEIEKHKRTQIELNRAQKELENALAKEKEINEIKSRFVSVVSHEYKIPLTSILTATHLIETYAAEGENDSIPTYVNKIKETVKKMTGLISDVLTVSKGDAVVIQNNPRPIDLLELVSDVVEEIMDVDQNDHFFKFNVVGHFDGAMIDAKLLSQVLTNLLSNAVKYSPKKSNIEFDVFREGANVNFEVQNSGIGIPESALPTLFEPFQRADNVGAIPGTGLGLSIVKKSVEAMGGDIIVESVENQGAKFTVIIPIRL